MHLCLDADLILLQYEILEGHTQLTHLHFMLPPFCRKSLCLWGSAHINSNLDGASRWVRAFANQKGEKPILQGSEVSQYNKTIGLMGQACYQAVSGNQSWKREGLVLSENIWFAEKLALSDQSMFRSLPSKVSGLGRFPWLWVGSHSSSRHKKRVDFIRDTWVLLLPSKNSSLSL